MPKFPVVESRVCGAGIGFRPVNKGFGGLGGRGFGVGNAGVLGEGNFV